MCVCVCWCCCFLVREVEMERRCRALPLELRVGGVELAELELGGKIDGDFTVFAVGTDTFCCPGDLIVSLEDYCRTGQRLEVRGQLCHREGQGETGTTVFSGSLLSCVCTQKSRGQKSWLGAGWFVNRMCYFSRHLL